VNLVDEARNLIDQLDACFYACYEDHPLLGELPRPGTAKLRSRVRRIKNKARLRLVRRMTAAGHPIPVRGAMWIINSRDSSWF
jgi:hypothetical protein